MAHRMNIVISPRCRAMMKDLAKDYGSMSRVVEMAVTEFYNNQQEMKTMNTDTATRATHRINETPSLQPHRDILLDYEWDNQDEHLQWVATADEAEILEWVASIRDAETD